MAVAAAAVVGLAAGVAGTAVVVGLADGDRTAVDPGPITLVAYDTCDSALRELKEAALPHVGPYGLEGEFAVAMDSGAVGRAEGDVAVAEGAGAAPDARAPVAQAPAAPRAAEPGVREQSGHSGTNTHESDVDEPDIVKTDGRRVVSVADGRLRVVDVATHRQTANLALPTGYATQLLIAGDRALVLTASGGIVEPMPRPGGVVPAPVPVEPSPAEPTVSGGEPGVPVPDTPPGDTPPDEPAAGGGSPGEPVPDPPVGKRPTEPPVTPPADPAFGSRLALVDLSGTGKVLGTLALEGSYLDARQVGPVARVVVRSTPRLKFTYPDGLRSPAAAASANRDVVEASSVSDWLPRYQLSTGGRVSSGELVECTAVSHPHRYTGAAMLNVLTFDLRRELGTGEAIGIAADGDTVYGTGTNLYVADDHFAHAAGFGPTDRPLPQGQRTEIYQFDISAPGRPRHVASGGVEGSLLNQYSLSEYDGNLRVATTAEATGESHSMVSVLTRRGDQLAQVGRVDGLGKGERIYAVRFLGARAYVVTFRQTDPLYTVDLSAPAQPRVTGELKITGYSAYLHPLGADRLLGVGQEATAEGMTTGTQVSLFDTSDQRGAERIRQLQFPGGHSEVEGDPHAFLYWPAADLVVLPMTTTTMDPSSGLPDSGALVLTVSDDRLVEKGMVRHVAERYGGMPVVPRRALVIGGELWTVSDAGILVSDVDSLARVAWLPFG